MSSFLLDERGVIVTCAGCGQNVRMPYEKITARAKCPKCQGALPSIDVPLAIEDAESFMALTQRSALPVLVDFWAEWCGPCKMIAPELMKVATRGAGRWVVAKVNTEQLPAVAQQFRVSSIPLLVLFRDGKEVARQAGALPAGAIEQFVNQTA